MRHIVLLACASKKLDRPAKAKDLYQSDLFKKSLAYARSLAPDQILILSAEHGVIDLDETIAPYDVTLNRMSAAEVRAWSKSVLAELTGRFDLDRDVFTFLAGARYRKRLLPSIRNARVPMKGLRIGQQLQFLKRAVEGS